MRWLRWNGRKGMVMYNTKDTQLVVQWERKWKRCDEGKRREERVCKKKRDKETLSGPTCLFRPMINAVCVLLVKLWKTAIFVSHPILESLSSFKKNPMPFWMILHQSTLGSWSRVDLIWFKSTLNSFDYSIIFKETIVTHVEINWIDIAILWNLGRSVDPYKQVMDTHTFLYMITPPPHSSPTAAFFSHCSYKHFPHL